MGACAAKEEAGRPVPTSEDGAPPARIARPSRSGGKDECIYHSQFILQNTGRVDDVYKIDSRKLGEGAYGCVVLGTHKATGVLRAIKKISKAHVKDIVQFRQEIAIMKVMDHPNIIRLFETFEDRQHIFLVMELCQGGELFDRIVQAGHFGEREAATVVQHILRAVFYMHERDICHRDLKPENFLLQSKGPMATNVLKLIDFGTARQARERTTMTTKAGTPYYVAPQVLTRRYDRKCDLWSCGAIMYTLLCGSPPFTGSSDAQIMARVRQGRLTFRETAWKGISEEAKFLVRQLMRMNPAERYSAEQALNHEWITSLAPKAPEVSIQDGFLDRWRRYQSQDRLRKAALHIIAGQLNNSETKKLRETFTALDADGNGLLTRTELKEGLEQAGLPMTESDLQCLMEAVDSDCSGVIDYTEFIAASIDAGAIDRDVCWTAFSVFDRDGDGTISAAELAQVLDNGKLKPGSAEAMRRLDSNNDGKIDFQEFMQMMNVQETIPYSGDCEHCGCGSSKAAASDSCKPERREPGSPSATARQGGA